MNESISWFQFIRLLSSLMSACSSVNPRCLITSQVNSWWWPWNCLLLVSLFLPSEIIPVWSVGSVAGMENSCPSRRIHPEPLFSALLFPSALFLDCHTYSFFYDFVLHQQTKMGWHPLLWVLCNACAEQGGWISPSFLSRHSAVKDASFPPELQMLALSL